MTSRLISEIIPGEKLENARWFSYFLEHITPEGNRELLPSDNHAAAYPLTTDKQNHVVDGKVNFYNKSFKQGFSGHVLDINNDIELFINNPVNNNCIIINLLDNCYGHSLLKMFNIPLFYREYSKNSDFLIICPPSLKAFIPKDICNIIAIKKNFTDFENGYELTEIINNIQKNYKNIEYAFLNTYQQYLSKDDQFSFFNFFNNIEKQEKLNRNIVFYYRKDKNRRWGFCSRTNKITGLFRFLSGFFSNIDFVVIGEKDSAAFPDAILDLRCDQFNESVEYQYNNYLGNSLFVVGVHGSHLILPSLLSRQVFHLVPKYKLKNSGEDVFNVVGNSIGNFGKDVHLPLNALNALPSSRNVASSILIHFLASLQKEYKMLDPSDIVKTDQDNYITMKYPELKYLEALSWWNSNETCLLRMNKILKR